jgi:hypothetical protein
MGLPGEVPFCTLCLTADKRSPEFDQVRTQAKIASRTIYREFDELAQRARRKGTLDEVSGQLEEFEFASEPGVTVRPFAWKAARYRGLIGTYGFLRRSRILMLGCSSLGFAPFLAEACEQFTIADHSAEVMGRAAALCRRFGFAVEESLVTTTGALTAHAGSYDAAWIDGETLLAFDRRSLLNEVRRILSPSGRIHVHLAPGPGRLLSPVGNTAPAVRGGRELGSAPGGAPSLFTTRNLRVALRQSGFRLDASRPLSIVWKSLGDLSNCSSEDLTGLLSGYDIPQDRGAPAPRVEASISFSATCVGRSDPTDALATSRTP